jgi:hypothetical protein
MLAGRAALLEVSHMYRSSLTLAFVVLYSAAGAASDLSSVYVAPGGIYAPSADVYVRPGPAHRQRPYAEPGYGYRQPSYGTVDPAYRAPASVYGEYERPYAAQPVYVDRAPAYSERYYAPERHYARERYYAQEQDYAVEYVPRPPLPVPYRARARCDDGYGRWISCD